MQGHREVTLRYDYYNGQLYLMEHFIENLDLKMAKYFVYSIPLLIHKLQLN